MEILFSDEFKKDYRRIKDNLLRIRIIKAIKKLEATPYKGKPLRHNLKGHRRLIVKPFRVIYKIENDIIEVITFEHRKAV